MITADEKWGFYAVLWVGTIDWSDETLGMLRGCEVDFYAGLTLVSHR